MVVAAVSQEPTVHNFAPPLVDDGGGWRQFISDSVCPFWPIPPNPKLIRFAPCVIWVKAAGKCDCGETEYTCHQESVKLMELASGVPISHARNWVCGHQGRFLE